MAWCVRAAALIAAIVIAQPLRAGLRPGDVVQPFRAGARPGDVVQPFRAAVGPGDVVQPLRAGLRLEEPVAAQQVCYAIAPRETASQVAARLTGDGRNHDAAWFRIVDHRWRVIPKRNYGALQPDWLACVDHGLRGAVAADRATTVAPGVDLTFLIVGGAFLGAFGSIRVASRYARRRRARLQILRRFGGEFVREFVRPWSEFRSAGAAPRARLRLRPRRAHVEVLLSPADGGSYPNLSDHRGNVEYDVARVMAALGGEAFVRQGPYTEGSWVVLPFEFRGSVKQEGVR